jgi:polar amino acid transport system substrate-binding protein
MNYWVKTICIATLLLFVLAACGGADKPAQESSATDTSPTVVGETDEPDTPEATEIPPTTAPTSPPTAVSIPDFGGQPFTVGSDTTYLPMEFIHHDTKEIVGFDVDMMQEIGNRINATFQFQPFKEFEQLFAALAEGQFDLVVSSASITEERQQIVAFSDPYLSIGQVVSVQATNDTITSVLSLATVDLVGVQTGTTGDDAAQAVGVPEEKIKRYPTIDMAFQDLAIGAIHAVIADGPLSAYYASQVESIKVVGEPFTTEAYAIALPKGNTDLMDAINAALAQMKADGTLEALLIQWNLQDVATIP